MIEITSRAPSVERIDELLDIVVREDSAEPHQNIRPQDRDPESRKYLEFLQLQRRSLNSLGKEWPTKRTRRVDFLNAPLSDLKDWLERATNDFEERTLSSLLHRAACSVLTLHAPARMYIPMARCSPLGPLTQRIRERLPAQDGLLNLGKEAPPSVTVIASVANSLIQLACELSGETSRLVQAKAWSTWFFGDQSVVPSLMEAQVSLAETPSERADGLNNLALWLNENRHFVLAERFVLRALELAPKEPFILLNAARWLELGGRSGLSGHILGRIAGDPTADAVRARHPFEQFSRILDANLRVRGFEPSAAKGFRRRVIELLYTPPFSADEEGTP